MSICRLALFETRWRGTVVLSLFSFCSLILSACGSESPAVQTVAADLAAVSVAETVAAVPTHTPLPTHTAFPTYTPAPTQTPRIVVVTATPTQTPEFTPTITLTPSDTPLPTATTDPRFTRKPAGFYLIGEEIAPGIWRSRGDGESCYWSITTRVGEIMENFYGMAGGTVFIPPEGFQVELQRGCGDWEYIGPP
jgi:hypothetical protein